MTRRRRTEYHYDEVDTEALERSLTLTLREPDRRAQIVEVCLFAASHCQTKALKLKLWELPHANFATACSLPGYRGSSRTRWPR
jgi:hypothetical protein